MTLTSVVCLFSSLNSLMVISTLVIRWARLATAVSSDLRISGAGAGAGAGVGASAGAGVGVGVGDGDVVVGVTGFAAGGEATFFPVAFLNKLSISDCASMLPLSLIICSKYHNNFRVAP